MSETLFREVAPRYMLKAMHDFGLTDFQAAGMFGNLGHESAGFSCLQEINPTVAGSRGGYGWAQWTGPRRRAFEAYARRNRLDLKDHETNYKFLFVELKGTENHALAALKRSRTLESATQTFMETFERPGIPHLNSRTKWARIALDAMRKHIASTEPIERKKAERQYNYGWWFAASFVVASAILFILKLSGVL